MASRVIELGPDFAWVYVSHDGAKRWLRGESACVGTADNPVACGRITEVLARYAKLEIDTHATRPTRPQVNEGKEGTFVSVRFRRVPIAIGALVSAKNWQRAPASTPQAPIKTVAEAKPELNHYELLRDDIYPLNAATIGLNLVFPFFHFQQALTQHFALGLGVTHMTLPTQNGQFIGPGGVLSFNWYSAAPFTGWYVELGVAAYDLRAQQGSISEAIVGFSGMLYFGHRWRWSWGLNFGIGVG
ncbi:MAG: hypothetical protein KDD39_16820, partial [Bdellovibrionales bacterium]|nr:hypothetical protein [Bdellovibrionales bacterium]